MGARTAPIRTKIVRNFTTCENWVVQETGNTQFNINVDDPAKKEGQKFYLSTLLDSRFVLCPRGYGTSSYRLFETMRLGRVPVIISDEWVPPLGPSWLNCSIRISEKRVRELPTSWPRGCRTQRRWGCARAASGRHGSRRRFTPRAALSGFTISGWRDPATKRWNFAAGRR